MKVKEIVEALQSWQARVKLKSLEEVVVPDGLIR